MNPTISHLVLLSVEAQMGGAAGTQQIRQVHFVYGWQVGVSSWLHAAWKQHHTGNTAATPGKKKGWEKSLICYNLKQVSSQPSWNFLQSWKSQESKWKSHGSGNLLPELLSWSRGPQSSSKSLHRKCRTRPLWWKRTPQPRVPGLRRRLSPHVPPNLGRKD